MTNPQPDNLTTAIANADEQRLQELLEQGENPGGLGLDRVPHIHRAVETGVPRIVQQLLKAGASANQVDDDGTTPLMIAAGNSSKELLGVLVAAGANANAAHDYDGSTPLTFAIGAAYDTPQLIAELIRLGADPNQPGHDGETPLMHAIMSQHYRATTGSEPFDNAAFEELLDAGANIHATTSQNDTALHFAAATGQRVFARRLLELGANVEARNNLGFTPVLSAASQGHTQMVRFLTQTYLANPDVVDQENLGVAEHFQRWLQEDAQRRAEVEEIRTKGLPF